MLGVKDGGDSVIEAPMFGSVITSVWQRTPTAFNRHNSTVRRMVETRGDLGELVAQCRSSRCAGCVERVGGSFVNKPGMSAAAGGFEPPHRPGLRLVDGEVGAVVDPLEPSDTGRSGDTTGEPLGPAVRASLDPHADWHLAQICRSEIVAPPAATERSSTSSWHGIGDAVRSTPTACDTQATSRPVVWRTSTSVRHPRQRGGQNQRSVALVDRDGQCLHLGERSDRTLLATIHRRSLHYAWVAHDQLVGERRLQHGVQNSVALGDRRLAQLACLRERCVPAAHDAWREFVQLDLTEARPDVQFEDRAVHLPSPRSQRRVLVDPLLTELGQSDLASTRVDPAPLDEIGLHVSQPTIGVGLGRERLGRGDQRVVDRVAVARLPSSGRQLSYRPERPVSHVSSSRIGWSAATSPRPSADRNYLQRDNGPGQRALPPEIDYAASKSTDGLLKESHAPLSGFEASRRCPRTCPRRKWHGRGTKPDLVEQKAIQQPSKGPLTCIFIGADDEIRTRDPHLGKVPETVQQIRFPW